MTLLRALLNVSFGSALYLYSLKLVIYTLSNWWYKAHIMGERNDNSDIIVYVICGLMALVLINTLMNWWTDSYVEAIKKATSLR